MLLRSSSPKEAPGASSGFSTWSEKREMGGVDVLSLLAWVRGLETPPCFRAVIPVGSMRNITVRFAGWPAE
jgi:hypothetical protein